MSNGGPPPVNPPDNNTANALNDIMNAGSTPVVNTIGSVIGTIADFSGAIGGIVSLVNTVIGILNPPQDPNKEVIDVVNRDFAALGASIKAQNIINRWNMTNAQLGPAETSVQGLPTLISGPPLTSFEITQTIGSCTTPLNILGLDPATGGYPSWTAVYSDEIYWTDAGLLASVTSGLNSDGDIVGTIVDVSYGPQAPPQPQGDLVFNYRFVLVTYLYALGLLLVTGKAIDPEFATATGYAGTLRSIIDLLSFMHDTIANSNKTPSEGIIQLSPPWKTIDDLVKALGRPLSGLMYGPTTNWMDSVTPSGVTIIYGAVETFSGYSSIASYNLDYTALPNYPSVVDFATGPSDQPYAPNFDPSFFRKFQIRLLKKTKQVYIGVGLLPVWRDINQLKALIGDPVSPRPSFADWSFRELFQVSSVGRRTDGLLHLKDLANLLLNTLPSDTATKAPAFRNLLSPALS